MKKCLIFLIIVLSIVFWYSYASAYPSIPNWSTSWNNCVYSIPNLGSIGDATYDPYPVFSQVLSPLGSEPYSPNANHRYNSNPTPDINLSRGMDETMYVIVWSDYASKTVYAMNSFVVSGGGTICTPEALIPPNYTSRIDSISVSTSTNKVNLTGYWNATTTSGVYEQLEFYQTNSIFGQEDYFTINATTSGAFNINFDYRNVATPYVGTTTIPLTSNQIFYANLYEKNPQSSQQYLFLFLSKKTLWKISGVVDNFFIF